MTAKSVDGNVERTNRVPLVLESLAAIIMGILLLVSPKNATQWLVLLFGLFWVVQGIVWVLSIFRRRKEWGWRLAGGIGAIVVGLLLLTHPAWSAYLGSALVVWAVGAGGFIIGVIMAIKGFAYREWGRAILGLIAIGASFLLVLGAALASFIVPILLGALAIAGGGYGLVMAFRKGSQPKAEIA